MIDPDNDFLDRLYNVYKNLDPNLSYRINKVEYLIPSYKKIESKLGDSRNAFRSIEVLADDSPESFTGEKGESINASAEGRPIYEIRHGDKAGTSVIIWSQMHGTESTATRALMDIFEFLLAEEDGKLSSGDLAKAKALRTAVASLNIHFIPMLNPDGANNWQRCAMQKMSGKHPALFVGGSDSFPVEEPGPVDINRDAWTMETAEARLLWRAFANFDRGQGEKQPVFGLTLHDQTNTSVGGYDKPASITMLSPAVNGCKYFNDARYRATQIIQRMDEQVQAERPGMTSRYSDDWGPVYFGDSISMMGAGMIVIESGQTKLDPEKLTLRRTNFKAILRALWEMAGDYQNIDPVDWAPPKEYNRKSHSASVVPKPPSRSVMYDVLLRNVLAPDGNEYNLGINRQMNVIRFDVTPGSTTLDGAKEHRSLWYYSSGFSKEKDAGPFHDNLTNPSARLNAGSKPEIPYLRFNNGHADSGYSDPGSSSKPNPLRYWGDVGYPSNIGMTMGPVWPAVPTDAAEEIKGQNTGSNLKTGDSVSFGLEELECGTNAGNLKILPAVAGGRVPATGEIVIEKPGCPASLYQSIDDITLTEAWELLRAGACAVRVSEAPESGYYNLPLVILAGVNPHPPTIGNEADDGENNFILADRSSGAAKYAVIGGYLIDLSKEAAFPIWGVRDGKQSALPVAGENGMYADSYQGHFRNIIRKGT